MIYFASDICLSAPRATIASCVSDQQCLDLFNRAKQESKSGNTDEALRLYKEAHERRADPRLLFSIARVLHKQSQWEPAVSYYERFIASPLRDDEQKQTAREYIEQCRAQIVLAKVPANNLDPKIEDRVPDSDPVVNISIGSLSNSINQNSLTKKETTTSTPQVQVLAPTDTIPRNGSAVPNHVSRPSELLPQPISPITLTNHESAKPLYSKGWFWGLLGGAAVVLIGITTAVVVATKSGANEAPAASGRIPPDNTIFISF